MATEAPLNDPFVRSRQDRHDPEQAERRAAEAMAEKLRREVDRFLDGRPRPNA